MYVWNVAAVEQHNTILSTHSLLEQMEVIAMMDNHVLDDPRHSNVDIERFTTHSFAPVVHAMVLPGWTRRLQISLVNPLNM